MDTEHGSKYADEQGVAEEETLKKGMEAKSKQFQEKGCGPLRKGVAFLPDK